MVEGLKKRFLSPSTRAWLAERKKAGQSWFDFLHGYVYARWPYLYIGTATGGHPKAKWFLPFALLLNRVHPFRGKPMGEKPGFADSYHGKAVDGPTAARLVSLRRDVDIHCPEQVLPYSLARELVIRNPDSIAVLDCPCRTSRKAPCLPLDVCIIIGEPFASFTVEHHPDRARRIGADEAQAILAAERERGHVAHAFFKDAMLNRFYAICNCCSCCCGAMQARRNGVEMLCSSGFVCRVDEAACLGCGNCVQACQFQALSLGRGEKGKPGPVAVDRDRCMGCGVCEVRCENRALALIPAPDKGSPLGDVLDQAGA